MNPAQLILVGGVRFYRWVLSPAKVFLFGPLSQCRFTPSCSAYALEAITRHGALAGSWLAVKRLARCHPWGGCGDDPVPPPPSNRLPAGAGKSLPVNRQSEYAEGHLSSPRGPVSGLNARAGADVSYVSCRCGH